MTEFSRYRSHVFWSDEDEGYIAVAPDLPGCSAFGETPSTAISELEDAIRAWIEAASAAGNAIPAPRKDEYAEGYSGKFMVRVPRTLHRNLAIAAERDGVSLNQYVNYKLTASLSGPAPSKEIKLSTQDDALRSDYVRALSSKFFNVIDTKSFGAIHEHRAVTGPMHMLAFAGEAPWQK